MTSADRAATGAKPLSKKELRASLDRVVEERDELREALRPFADIFERYEQVHDLDANEVVVPYVALFNAHKHFVAARAALQSGEGERHEERHAD